MPSKQVSPRMGTSGSVSKPADAPAAPPKDSELYNPSILLTISEQHKRELRTAFDMFDTQGTGRIRASEIKVALYALGYDVSKAEQNRLLQECGVDNSANDAVIDFNDFYNVLLKKMVARETRMDVTRAFHQVDADAKGYVSLQDLRDISGDLRQDLTDDELFEMILFAHPVTAAAAGAGTAADLDAKETMVVPEEEFLKLMKRANVY